MAESSQNLDARLWHLRLGHTSRKNLEILCKRNLIKVVVLTTWISVRDVLMGSKRVFLLVLENTTLKESSVMFTQTSGDHPVLRPSAEVNILSRLFMISHISFGCMC